MLKREHQIRGFRYPNLGVSQVGIRAVGYFPLGSRNLGYNLSIKLISSISMIGHGSRRSIVLCIVRRWIFGIHRAVSVHDKILFYFVNEYILLWY